MDICFSELKEKEIVNVFDGKKLGRVVDVLFDISTGGVKGIVVPGDKKLFKKNEDIFIPLGRLKKIGGDVILVKIPLDENFNYNNFQMQSQGASFENSRTGKREKNKNKYNFSNYPEYNYSQNAQNFYNYENGNDNGQRQSNTGVSYKYGGGESFVRYRPVEKQKYNN